MSTVTSLAARSDRLAFSPHVAATLRDSDLKVVVTGGGGWMGRATLEMLESAFGERTAARVRVFGSSSRVLILRSGRPLQVHPLALLPGSVVGPHLFAHYAFATREFVAELGLEAYVARNRAITAIAADHLARTGPVGFFSISSGAVYLGDDPATNPYGALKAEDERLFLEVARQDHRGGRAPRVVIPRLFNLAGPFLNKPERYVLGSVIEDIVRGGPIQLTATKPVVRSYVHVADLVDVGFAAMTGEDPLPDTPFDTAGEREIEVGELAELASAVLGRPGMPVERPPLDGSAPDRYVGDPTTLRSLAAAHGVPLKLLPRQIKETALYLGL